MVLIIGLGNPGKKFEGTPHNIGFEVLDKLAQKNNLDAPILNKKANCLLVEKAVINNEKVTLVYPQTFMNLSGSVLPHIQEDYRLNIIVHDDIDLPMGKIKISSGGGSGGHKGVESIIQGYGESFIRVKVGIMPPEGKPKNLEKFVLKKINKKNLPIMNQAVNNAAEALETILAHGLEKAMNEYNR